MGTSGTFLSLIVDSYVHHRHDFQVRAIFEVGHCLVLSQDYT